MDYEDFANHFFRDFQAKKYNDIPSLLSFLAVPLEVVCNRGRTNGGKPETWRHSLEGKFYEERRQKSLTLRRRRTRWKFAKRYSYMYSSSSVSTLENLQLKMTHPGTTARGERCRIPANVGGTGKCLKVLMVELI